MCMPKIDLLFITYILVYNTTLEHEVILDPPVEGGNGKERRGSGWMSDWINMVVSFAILMICHFNFYFWIFYKNLICQHLFKERWKLIEISVTDNE
jgi:hypothetical protein